jgi:hypothetical protein
MTKSSNIGTACILLLGGGRHERDHARDRQVQDLCLALAERFEGFEGLLRDKTGPSRIPKLDFDIAHALAR